MIEGNANGSVNVRSTSTDASSANIVGGLIKGDTFTATETFHDSKGRGIWLKIVSRNNIPITTPMWIAGWVVTYRIVPDPVPEEPLGVPIQIQMIEKFENGATRTTVWENPTVVE